MGTGKKETGQQEIRLSKPSGKRSVSEESSKRLREEQETQLLIGEIQDALVQTLFSANLIADVLPRIWEQDPQEGRVRLDELRQLTGLAMAEVRSLLEVTGLPSVQVKVDRTGNSLHSSQPS